MAKQELIIDRSKWLRGGKSPKGRDSASMLRNKRDQMCCLGFYSVSSGVASKRDILNQATPEGVLAKIADRKYSSDESSDELKREALGKMPETARWLFSNSLQDSRDCSRLVAVNDKGRIEPKEREKRIKEIFAEHGVKVIFTGV